MQCLDRCMEGGKQCLLGSAPSTEGCELQAPAAASGGDEASESTVEKGGGGNWKWMGMGWGVGWGQKVLLVRSNRILKLWNRIISTDSCGPWRFDVSVRGCVQLPMFEMTSHIYYISRNITLDFSIVSN